MNYIYIECLTLIYMFNNNMNNNKIVTEFMFGGYNMTDGTHIPYYKYIAYKEKNNPRCKLCNNYVDNINIHNSCYTCTFKNEKTELIIIFVYLIDKQIL